MRFRVPAPLRPLALALGAVLLAASGIHAQKAAAAPRPVDWDALRDETVRVLAEYIRVNTTNPPGNELAAARYLQGILRREGIEAQLLDTLELGPGRANLYARLRGNGRGRALALVHHMDVVPADPRYWSVDPFAGAVKDGFVWGRGAQDMKGNGIVQLITLIAIKRSGLPLNRDLVFIGNADEEVDGRGALVFVERHPDLLRDVEYLLTEGGGGGVVRNGRTAYTVGVAEKRALWQHVTVHGVPSHGSMPTRQNPVPRLVAALDRIAAYETPLHLTPAVERYFQGVSGAFPEPQRGWMADVRTALRDSAAREWILGDPGRNALLRNTISLTGLQGSNKVNVIPAEAAADIDVRLLPDQDPQAFMDELRRVAADT
ncbi:MAG: M20/M25/M40 family metallo-hydrolase, partial [Gemmatimonadetes bacterium]|nr:M20/M25/M40 family metallo-hydrolase [Gemmatimonadota bacterium]